jgi:hypothetical protein
MLAQQRMEAGVRRDEARVADDWLDDHARDPLAMLRERRADRSLIVERHAQRQLGQRLRHTWRIRQSQRRHATAGLHEERIAVTVIAAVELEDEVAARRGARQPHGGHRRFRAAVDEADHLH